LLFLGFIYVIYYKMAHPHLCHHYEHQWKQATGMVETGRAQQQTTTTRMGRGQRHDEEDDNEDNHKPTMDDTTR
jgi:hypothetical protein